VFTWTGNNVDATGDMARRAVTVEFNGRNVIEDGGFPIEDPLTYAHDHRADLLRAALGLLSHTLRDPGASVLEADKIGFPEWRRYVAGPILRAFGEDITRSVREHYVEAQADDRDRLAVAAMAAVLELDRNYRAKEIADAFNGYSKEGNEVLDLLGYTTHERGKIAANSIGARVKKLKGKRSPDGKVTLTYEHQKGENVYLIRLASAGPGSPGEKAPV
jgi:hypothetical protein